MENTRPPQDVDRLFSIRIDGLDDSVSKEDLARIFSSYGEVGDYYIPRNRDSTGNRGFGFVRFVNEEDANKALGENGSTINGKEITVTMAKARPARRERRRSSRSRSRSYGSRRRRYSRSYSRSRSHSHRKHHDHHHHSHHRSHRSSHRDSSNSNSRRDDSKSKSVSRSRSRSRSRSLSQDNKMSE